MSNLWSNTPDPGQPPTPPPTDPPERISVDDYRHPYWTPKGDSGHVVMDWLLSDRRTRLVRIVLWVVVIFGAVMFALTMPESTYKLGMDNNGWLPVWFFPVLVLHVWWCFRVAFYTEFRREWPIESWAMLVVCVVGLIPLLTLAVIDSSKPMDHPRHFDGGWPRKGYRQRP